MQFQIGISACLSFIFYLSGSTSVLSETEPQEIETNMSCNGQWPDHVIVDADGKPAFAYLVSGPELNHPFSSDSFHWAKDRMPQQNFPPCFIEPVYTDNVHHSIEYGSVEIHMLVQADGIRLSGGNNPLHTKKGFYSSTYTLREYAAALSASGSFGEITPGFSGQLFGDEASPYAVSPVLIADQDFAEPISGEPMMYSCRNFLATHPEPHAICEVAYQLKDRIFVKYSVSTSWVPYSGWRELDAFVQKNVLRRAGY